MPGRVVFPAERRLGARGWARFAAALASVVVAGWVLQPQCVVWELGWLDPKSDRHCFDDVCDRLVELGPRSVPAILRALKGHSPWVRNYCYLPSVLARIGPAAHADLVRAIDRTGDPRSRACLISTLQSDFRDFSRFDVFLEDAQAGRLSRFATEWVLLDSRLDEARPPAWVVDEEGRINGEFIAWWYAYRDSGGSGWPDTTIPGGGRP